jgi:hypothetical protein
MHKSPAKLHQLRDVDQQQHAVGRPPQQSEGFDASHAEPQHADAPSRTDVGPVVAFQLAVGRGRGRRIFARSAGKSAEIGRVKSSLLIEMSRGAGLVFSGVWHDVMSGVNFEN